MRSILVVMGVLALSACGDDEKQNLDQSNVLAKVGEVAVTSAVFDVALKSRRITQANQQQKQAVFDDLVAEAAMASASVKDQLPLTAEQLSLLQYQQMKFQAQNALEAYMKKNPVSEADIAQEYQTVVKATKGLQFHVQHLLFRDEVEALQVLDQIKAGTVNFQEAMTAYLSSRPQMRNVGDIGWVNLQQVPASFHAPLESLDNDSVYAEVVLSDFGAHVLFLKEKKAAEPPSLEVAQAGIKKSLEARLKDKFEQLALAKAKVQLFQKIE